MRQIFIALAVFIFLSACANDPVALPPSNAAQPALINLPLVDSPQLTQFQFVDEKDGWGMTESQIVRTDDGGITWHNATPAASGQFGYIPFVFLDARNAWILLPADDYITGTLFHTTDGGSTWTSGVVPFAYGSLQFLDSQNGFMLASLGAGAGSQAVALFQASDAGFTWTRVFINNPTDPGANSSLPLGGQKYGFTFLDASRGWVGGGAPIDNYIYLYQTRDGGVNWSEMNLALPAGYESAQTGNAGPEFFSASDGILVVNLVLPSDPGLATVVYYTRDGGETWTAGAAIPSGRPSSFFSVSGGVAWGGGQFHVTRDAGQSWSTVTPNEDFTARLGSLQFVSPLIGWALTVNEASDPSLYKTTDGGATWTLIIQ